MISPAGHDPGITTNIFVNLLILSCLSCLVKLHIYIQIITHTTHTNKVTQMLLVKKNHITTKGAQMEHLFLHFCNKIVKTGSPKSLSGMDFPPEHKNRGLSGDCNEDEETIFLQKF